jgi:hypothetical protein
MKMPIRARAATPPTTTPAISPVEGPELESEEAAAVAVDEDGSSEEVVDAALSVGDASDEVGASDEVVSSDVVAELLGSLVALVPMSDVIAAAILVGSAGVGNEPTTLPTADVITAVGTVTPFVDKTDETPPTILEKRSPICLLCRRCLRCTISAPMLPAAWQ